MKSRSFLPPILFRNQPPIFASNEKLLPMRQKTDLSLLILGVIAPSITSRRKTDSAIAAVRRVGEAQASHEGGASDLIASKKRTRGNSIPASLVISKEKRTSRMRTARQRMCHFVGGAERVNQGCCCCCCRRHRRLRKSGKVFREEKFSSASKMTAARIAEEGLVF